MSLLRANLTFPSISASNSKPTRKTRWILFVGALCILHWVFWLGQNVSLWWSSFSVWYMLSIFNRRRLFDLPLQAWEIRRMCKNDFFPLIRQLWQHVFQFPPAFAFFPLHPANQILVSSVDHRLLLFSSSFVIWVYPWIVSWVRFWLFYNL